jgi:hypothetical protein
MQAHRVLIETDGQGRPKDLPILPAHAKLEAIFLVLDEEAKPVMERRPPPSLAGLKIVGDIVAPAIDQTDWTMSS